MTRSCCFFLSYRLILELRPLEIGRYLVRRMSQTHFSKKPEYWSADMDSSLDYLINL